MDAIKLKIVSEKNRKRLIELIYKAGAGHTGGDLSCLNLLTALYHEIMNVNKDNVNNPSRDRFIMSKGHCVESLFVTLESKSIIPVELVDTLGTFNSPLAGHPTNNIPGIEVNSGALGHGLSIGIGMALAAKMNNQSYNTYVLMGDGEQGEGSIYEAAMAAKQYRLGNLVAIIDRNRLQISGNTEDIMSIDDIFSKWTNFGWDVKSISGDEIEEILSAFKSIDYLGQKPHLIVAYTTKGKGVSYMENDPKWHHGVPSEEQYHLAIEEIQNRIENICNQ